MVSQACAQAYRSNAVLTASPGQLVLMLYDGALRAMAIARDACDLPETDVRRYEIVNAQLLKAQNIIAELQATLNPEAGDGQFAREMQRLYDYYQRKLMEANMRKDPAPIRQVERLLGEVRDAWAEMLRSQEGAHQTMIGSKA